MSESQPGTRPSEVERDELADEGQMTQLAQRRVKITAIRNLIGFWLLGLCNNYGYVVMLSAAHDILKEEKNETNSSNIHEIDNGTGKLIPDCNPIGTGAILLADILPALIVKLTAPWYILRIPYSIRVIVVIVLSAASYPVVAVPKIKAVNMIGVVLASAGSGLGEITFLSLTSKYSRNTISTWSSGTGAAGVFGAVSYAGLTAAGVSPRDAILIMLVIPALMAVSYFWILAKEPQTVHVEEPTSLNDSADDEETDLLMEPENRQKQYPTVKDLNFVDKLRLVKPLLKYMIPLGLVYFAEYFINQALFELLSFPHSRLPVIQQYRWYQTIYQIGVFISRSSVNIIKIRRIWIMTILQFCVLAFLLTQVLVQFLPSIWVVFVVILFEGLLGGLAYVNTFYWISYDYKDRPDVSEFSLGVASLADSSGIAVAGAVSLPVHNYLCTL